MCLYIHKNSRRTKAVEDITVYKILSVNENGEFRTPYRSFEVEIGNTYESVLNRDRVDKNKVSHGLHTYKKLDEVKTEIESNPNWYGNSVIVRCTIPKNSFFYKGLFEKFTSYASTRLRYDEIVRTYDRK